MFSPLAPPRERTTMRRTAEPGLRPALLLATGAIHAALIAACCLLIVNRAAPPSPPDAGMQVVFAQPTPPPPVTTTLATTTLEPRALPVIATLAPVPPIAIVQGAGRRHPRSMPLATHRHSTAQPSVAMQPDAAAQAPAHPTPRQVQPAPPQIAAPAALAGWEARIRQAVQDAAIYPAAARLQHRQGRAQVQFDYLNGTVATLAIAQSSQSTTLDAAALSAVTHARMPPPPPEIGPQTRTMLVWVQFSLVAED